MPRRKISEYRAKTIVAQALGLPYEGWPVNKHTASFDIEKITTGRSYVVKVDQAVKGRFKKGLVALEVAHSELASVIDEMAAKGFEHFLVEPFAPHETGDERYLSISRGKDGLSLSASREGGIDIESQAESIEAYVLGEKTDWSALSEKMGLDQEVVKALVRIFDGNHFSFLEINPYLVDGGRMKMLDLAVEVDDAAQYLVDAWSGDDMRTPPRVFTTQEEKVYQLNETSPASFTLQMINPDGAIFLLLSGGGASVVVADEIYSAGLGAKLANYGEYSGNPTLEETYVYASAVFELLLASKAQRKVLFIGGAVANFTNIEKTFGGIIRVIHENAEELQKQNIKIVVRRGGPHQKAGLANIRRVLEQYDLLGAVYDPSTSIGSAVSAATKEVRS